MQQLLRLAGAVAVAVLAWSAAAAEDPKICFRDDAAPFSFMGEDNVPAGYSVDLCRIVLDRLGVAEPELVLVTAEDRFDKLTKENACQVLCEATTVTMDRRTQMEFSLITFLTGAALMYPKSLLKPGAKPPDGITVGFLRGTTAHEKWKDGTLIGGTAFNLAFESVDDHSEAVERLKDQRLLAYVADREILERILSENPELDARFTLGRRSLSYEPYALAVDMGNDALRVRVDEVLADLFRERDGQREINEILERYIPQRRFDPLLIDLFELQSLPD